MGQTSQAGAPKMRGNWFISAVDQNSADNGNHDQNSVAVHRTSSKFKVQSSKFKVQGSKFHVSGFRIQGKSPTLGGPEAIRFSESASERRRRKQQLMFAWIVKSASECGVTVSLLTSRRCTSTCSAIFSVLF